MTAKQWRWEDLTSAIEEVDELMKLLDTWRIALQTIANGDDDGRWGRIALAALDKERKP